MVSSMILAERLMLYATLLASVVTVIWVGVILVGRESPPLGCTYLVQVRVHPVVFKCSEYPRMVAK